MPRLELAFDLSGPSGTLCVAEAGGTVLRECECQKGLRHNTELVATWDAVLRGIGATPADVACLHVGIGPGSFTGLRVACAAAQGFVMARPACRIVPVPAAEALRTGVGGPVGIVLAWKRGWAWTAAWDGSGNALLSPADRPLADGLAVLPSGATLCGDFPADMTLPPGFAIRPGPPVASQVLAAGRRLAAAGGYATPFTLQPLYPRRPEAVVLWEQRHGPNPQEIPLT